MCTCASCEYTNSRKEWPSGAPMGKRASDAAYAAHVRHGKAWGRSPSGNMHHAPEFSPAFWSRSPDAGTGGTQYTRPAKCFPGEADAKAGIAAYIAAFESRNGLKKTGQAEAQPARPAQPGKAAQHLPELNRQPEPRAILYVMKQGKSPYMTVSQAADALECSPARILQWIHGGRIPGAIKPARDWLIPANAKRPEELPRGRPKAQASR